MSRTTISRRPRGRSREEELNTEAEEEETPRRRPRARNRDEDADEAPRSRSSRRSRDEDEDDEAPRRRPRSARSDDDDDEPSSSIRRPKTGKGWSSFDRKRTSGDWNDTWKLPEEQTLIKIFEDEPFSVYREHWIDDVPQGMAKSYFCLDQENEGNGCPLCDAGDKPRTYVLFNILDLSDPDNPKVFPWKVSQTVADTLERYARDPKTSPINGIDRYWCVFKSGGKKKGRIQTNIQPVKARDLVDDWDVDPFSEEELDDFKLFTEDDVHQIRSKSQLKDVVEYLD